jgi:hypothetical protein
VRQSAMNWSKSNMMQAPYLRDQGNDTKIRAAAT